MKEKSYYRREKKGALFFKMAVILGELGWSHKHESALMILIQRISDIEKSWFPYACFENKVIDEVGDELLNSMKYLLNDK